MLALQSLIDSTHNILRTTLSEVESLKKLNTVGRTKAESLIKKNLDSLSQRTIEIEKQSQILPIHEKSRIFLIVKELKDKQREIAQSLQQGKKYSIELTSRQSEENLSVSNTDLQRQNEILRKKQDHDIDRLLETVSNVKNTGREIGDELEFHIKLLENTESSVDATTMYMSATTERMIKLVDKSSNNCLVCIIVLLLILIFLTLYLL